MNKPTLTRPYWIVYQENDSRAQRFIETVHSYSLADALAEAEWKAAHHMGHGGEPRRQLTSVYGGYCRREDAEMVVQ